MSKYLHYFEAEGAFENAYYGEKYHEPWVSRTIDWDLETDRVDYNMSEEEKRDRYKKIPLTFEITSDGDIRWVASATTFTKTIEYKKNDSEWASITSNTGASAPSISVVSGDTIQFRGDNATYSSGYGRNNCFSGTTCGFKIKGNIMSLIDSTGFTTALTLTDGYNFNGLFLNCSYLTDASKLVLPATALTQGCYRSMFAKCWRLAEVPELPATTLASECYQGMYAGCPITAAPELPALTGATYCYGGMFSGCTLLSSPPVIKLTTLDSQCCISMFEGCRSLTTAPELPATILATSCYASMFRGCSSLTTAPELPATILAGSCYSTMFAGCTSLTTAPELPASALVSSCYQYMFSGCTSLTTAPELPATTLANYCYRGMFNRCTGLTTTPAILPATTLAEYCYDGMFSQCYGLTTAPVLPATTLANYCYDAMFNQCTGLTAAPELPATTLANYCYRSMFYECFNISYIKCLATNISASNCTSQWVAGVQTTSGTFVKNANMSSWTTGFNGIPSNWTVQDAS